MKNYLLLLSVIILLAGAGCAKTKKHHEPAEQKFYKVNLIYNSAIGYSWYLQNESSLKSVRLVSEDKTPGAFEETLLANPYTQTFTFILVNPEALPEELTFDYKHYLEKDEPHYEGRKIVSLDTDSFN